MSFIMGIKRHSNLHYAQVNKSLEVIQWSWRTEIIFFVHTTDFRKS